MPELPEVETSRAHVELFCGGSTITTCRANEQGGGPRDGQFDDLVIGEGITSQSLKSALEGRTIVDIKRRGKQMWFVLDKPPHPLFHFGMTGAFTVEGERRHNFVKFKIGSEWPPRFTKLELEMSNGARLALTDPRRLARVRLREEPEASPPISLLAPDPLTHPISLEAFAAAVAKPTAPIKAVLLAQDRVVSGVGNWVADEVCFQASVHPGAACNTLAPQQVAALHAKLLSVCRDASEWRADYTSFPKEWLFHHRWGKGKGGQGSPRVSSGHPICFEVVGGRTTAIVSALQHKGLLSASSGARKAAAPAMTGKRASKIKTLEGGIANTETKTEPGADGVPHHSIAAAATTAPPPKSGRAIKGKSNVVVKGEARKSSASKGASRAKAKAARVTVTKVPRSKAAPTSKVKPEQLKVKKAPPRGEAKVASKAAPEVNRVAEKSGVSESATKRARGEGAHASVTSGLDGGKRAKSAGGAVKLEDVAAAVETAKTVPAKAAGGRRSSRLAR